MTPRSSVSVLAAARVALLVAFLVAVLSVSSVHADNEPTHCVGCMDGMPMPNCPKPQQCGYKPILCVDCMAGMAMPLCQNATWCAGINCDPTQVDCKPGVPTATCPDPGTCNVAPIPCYGCTPGNYRYSCPDPTLCSAGMSTPPCMNCMAGMPMKYCPNATWCEGMGPAPTPFVPVVPPLMCEGCMAGMAMPMCPYPDQCPAGCPMQMYFGAQDGTCLLLQSWKISSGAQWFGAVMFVLLLAGLREGLSVWRTHASLKRRQLENLRRLVQGAHSRKGSGAKGAPLEAVLMKNQSSSESNLDPASPLHLPAAQSDFSLHFFDSFYYLLSLSLGYLLMLLIMTYQVYLCLLVVLACFVTHFALNYLYHSKIKKRYMANVRKQAEDIQMSLGSPAGSPSGAVAGGSAVQFFDNRIPITSGEHCCEDTNFDD